MNKHHMLRDDAFRKHQMRERAELEISNAIENNMSRIDSGIIKHQLSNQIVAICNYYHEFYDIELSPDTHISGWIDEAGEFQFGELEWQIASTAEPLEEYLARAAYGLTRSAHSSTRSEALTKETSVFKSLSKPLKKLQQFISEKILKILPSFLVALLRKAPER